MTAAVAPTTDARLELDLGTGVARWDALGTYVHLRAAEPGRVLDAATLALDVLDEVDATCSRFRDDSDLMRVNRRGGRHDVPPVLAGAIRVALDAAAQTGGIVDPTLGSILVAGGYDRTFGLVAPESPCATALPVSRSRWEEIRVGDDWVEVPGGTFLDLGATGKAYAADLVAHTVHDVLGVASVVSVGGDVRALGAAGTTWPVALASTRRELSPDATVVGLADGLGLATSSTAARRWVRAGRQWHHIVDPRTGSPAAGPWRTVTALGASCSAANTASTAAIVLGDGALAWLTAHDVAARLVANDGSVHPTPAWEVHA